MILEKRIGLLLGPALFLLLFSIDTIEPLKPEAQKVLAVAIWMLVWWMTEAVNISVTALLPIALLPLLNIEKLGVAEVTAPLASKIINLFHGRICHCHCHGEMEITFADCPKYRQPDRHECQRNYFRVHARHRIF